MAGSGCHDGVGRVITTLKSRATAAALLPLVSARRTAPTLKSLGKDLRIRFCMEHLHTAARSRSGVH